MTIEPSELKKTELFSTLFENELNFVSSRSSVLHLRKGAHLFDIGEKAKHFYILKSGIVRVFKPRNDDKGIDEMARFTPGDCIGDFDFARGADYDACAEAIEDSEIIMFPSFGLSMESFALEEPNIICKILLSSIVMMTGRIKSIRKLILENLSWVQELHRRAYEDPGTGLWKQTYLKDELNHLLNKPAGLILLKPDRFKILVDSRGHNAGDEAMIKIALILRNLSRRLGTSWPLRFKSNETGILTNNIEPKIIKNVAYELLDAISKIKPVPADGDIPEFKFSGTVVWTVWPFYNIVWNDLFTNSYELLMKTWQSGGNKVMHYKG
jgi:GGDEF domain-containing protein